MTKCEDCQCADSSDIESHDPLCVSARNVLLSSYRQSRVLDRTIDALRAAAAEREALAFWRGVTAERAAQLQEMFCASFDQSPVLPIGTVAVHGPLVVATRLRAALAPPADGEPADGAIPWTRTVRYSAEVAPFRLTVESVGARWEWGIAHAFGDVDFGGAAVDTEAAAKAAAADALRRCMAAHRRGACAACAEATYCGATGHEHTCGLPNDVTIAATRGEGEG